MQSIIDIENIANAHKSYSYIEAKSYDGLDIATQQIELAHKYYVQGTSSREDERKAIIDAIQIYIWPCMFEPEIKTRAFEVLSFALKYVDEYPYFPKQKYDNVCSHLYSKLVWYYVVSKEKERDEWFDKIYELFLSLGWKPNQDDISVAELVHPPSKKETFLKLLLLHEGQRDQRMMSNNIIYMSKANKSFGYDPEGKSIQIVSSA